MGVNPVRRNATRRTKATSKILRKEQTFPERLLWSEIRKLRGLGFHFRNQHAIADFVADFACPKLRLIIEIDGRSHLDQEDKDQLREHTLKTLGWSIIHFTNDEVIEDLDQTILAIHQHCEALANRSN
ncbi:MAG: endonuclease domain-containing protein [Fimbriimonadaceae bacterium]